ncbi:hypothetical protein AGR13a_Lc120128 [Agrobacterium genomosp. 13 str. CFBP 6927]|uniref:Transposase n=1 Tax=Agrobacterium genomosp. 13 str. CFBP 6927 TaxID=1183428 RepID=A0ABP2BP74_9HYPH|nr:hypothetical protein AGR13a_Lc120128 [Agrobacterium genomosp. 13 str. CFBP 6927]
MFPARNHGLKTSQRLTLDSRAIIRIRIAGRPKPEQRERVIVKIELVNIFLSRQIYDGLHASIKFEAFLGHECPTVIDEPTAVARPTHSHGRGKAVDLPPGDTSASASVDCLSGKINLLVKTATLTIAAFASPQRKGVFEQPSL